jgi:hypothetical protein
MATSTFKAVFRENEAELAKIKLIFVICKVLRVKSDRVSFSLPLRKLSFSGIVSFFGAVGLALGRIYGPDVYKKNGFKTTYYIFAACVCYHKIHIFLRFKVHFCRIYWHFLFCSGGLCLMSCISSNH